ncbi:MAG: hypothetical protein GF416_01160 [Candidatus Altiarchaeales archaeon]|nr:hypothetical protein [Candidatus Altiarchaeales archaeon]MBD3415725.1 hypothetical protein [Candidatus Altiarchaeales archaeon]
MNKKAVAVFLVLYLLTGMVSAKKILFYEVGNSKYSIGKEYSKFVGELRKKGFEVATIEKGSLTKEKLEAYDILVVQDLNKQLSTTEISSIIWFVLQKGRGLFINGAGGSGTANQLTIPFGVTIDGGTLIDNTDKIPGKDRNTFVLDRFTDAPSSNTLRRGVSKIGFYQGSGLFLSGTSSCIVTGNSDTYSDTGSFASGSMPCVAAASQFGGGLVFTLSDADILSNENLEQYNNKNFGINIVEWLGLASDRNYTSANSTTDLQLKIKELRLRTLQLEQEVEQLTDERESFRSKFNQASLTVTQLQQQILEAEKDTIGPFKKSDWALIILGVCILLAAIAYSKKKSGEVKIKDDDILNELGYELEGSSEGGEDDDLPDLGA